MNKIIYYLLISILFLSCSKKNEKENDTVKIDKPDMIQKNYKYYIYKNNKKYFYANIEYAEFFNKKEMVLCDKVYGQSFNSKGENTTILIADKAVIDKKEKQIILSENVIVELIENKLKLHSDELILDYNNNKLISKEDILIEKEDGSYIKASSMDSSIKEEITNFKDMEIKYFYDDDKNE